MTTTKTKSTLHANRLPRILYLVPTDYDSLCEKGVDKSILERDEAGFFEKVITVHPFSTQNRIIDLNITHRIYEYSQAFKKNLPRVFQWIHFLWYIFKIQKEIRRIARIEKIDLIRANDPYYMGLIAFCVAKLRITKLPFCVSIHADYDKRYELDGAKGAPIILGSRKLANILEKFIYRKANLILPIRDSLRNKILKLGIPENKVSTIPHGIDFTIFEKKSDIDICKEFNLPNNKTIISFIGRLSKENYIYDIIEVAKRMTSRKDFIIVMIGGGVEENAIKSIVHNDPDLQSSIFLLGFQPLNIVAALRQQSQIALCLMGGFSIIEACAAKVPVIAYDVEWHHELVQNNITGALIEEGDIGSLQRSVEYFIDHPEMIKSCGEQAYLLARKRHEISHTSLIKKTCYLNLLSNSNFYGETHVSSSY